MHVVRVALSIMYVGSLIDFYGMKQIIRNCPVPARWRQHTLGAEAAILATKSVYVRPARKAVDNTVQTIIIILSLKDIRSH